MRLDSPLGRIWYRATIGIRQAIKQHRGKRKVATINDLAIELHRPETLELTEEQANAIARLFLSCPDIESVSRSFWQTNQRTSFLYFSIPNEKGDALIFGKPDATYESLELVDAAMHKLGAIVHENGQDYIVTTHPLTKRLAEIGQSLAMPQQRGIHA